MTQTSGQFPALYDGVGSGKKKPKRKVIVSGVKAKLDKLHARVKGKP